MPFDWKEFLNLAEHLHKNIPYGCSEEAAKRSSVSRAYYAVFCHIRNYTETNWGFRPTYKAEDHKELRNFLKNTGRTQLASNLDKLRQWRNMCDYDNNVANLDRLVKSALKLAQSTIRRYP